MKIRQLFSVVTIAITLQACSDDADPSTSVATPPSMLPPVQVNNLDAALRTLLFNNGISGDPSTNRDLPTIKDPLAELGKKLFFTKALGGAMDSACVTCHHPMLGGGDNLSLSVGVGAVDPDLLGLGRGDATGVPHVPRNAPTTFNIGLWDSSLFWDSRVESFGKELGQNGAASGISTPDSGFNVLDVDAGSDLVVAQARFPFTSVEEMRADLEAGQSNAALRSHLAARLGDYGIGIGQLSNADWLSEFQTAFVSADSAENLVTFDNIVVAIAAYERSQVFVDNPWRAYVQGDNAAIGDTEKRGAILFYTAAEQQGGGCVQCHSGDLFSDEQQHTIGAPQFGPGKGNLNNNDFGRENISGIAAERFRMRTPSLLNIAVTGPYMHVGAYEFLQQVLEHYNDPNGTVEDFFDDGAWCSLQQFDGVANCETLYPNAEQNSNEALTKVSIERKQNDPAALPAINLDINERNDIVAFLRSLTDPCVVDRECLAPWIPTAAEAVDEQQLNAIDVNGNPL